MIIVQGILIFLVPYLIIKFSQFKLTKFIGTIGMAYLLGIITALLIYGLNKVGVSITLNVDLGEISSFVTIAIAIPLLLFSANLIEVKKLSSTVLKSFLSLIISATLVTAIVFYVYGNSVEYGAELSGMAIGLYTGGTPNLNAIGNIFKLPGTIIATANLSDMIIGAVFYIFLLLFSKPLLKKILPFDQEEYMKEESQIKNIDAVEVQTFKISKRLLGVIGVAFVMALISAVVGVLIWILLGSVDGTMFDILVPTLMVGVTVFGIAGSFSKKIRETNGMNVVGQYFILVFSYALASSMNFNEMQDAFGSILVLYGVITVAVFIVHTIISRFMKINADCTIVTLTAGLYGPAFVPAITNQIKNDDLTAPGLITGAIGYAIGTFLGTGLALLFLL